MSVLAVKRRQPMLLALAVSLVAAHSTVLGITLIAAPATLLSFFGWSIDCHSFFLQQAGLFHILLGAFYAIEFFAYSRVRMLLIAKVSAVLFLSAQYVWSVREPGVLLSNCVDAGMAIVVGVLWWRAAGSKAAV